MLKYKVVLTKKAQKQLDKLSNKIVKPILVAIADLQCNPRSLGYKKLIGRDGYKIWTGDYRIIYDIIDDELIIDIIALGHRKNIYE